MTLSLVFQMCCIIYLFCYHLQREANRSPHLFLPVNNTTHLEHHIVSFLDFLIRCVFQCCFTAFRSSCRSSAKQNHRQSFCKSSLVLRSPVSTRSLNKFIHQLENLICFFGTGTSNPRSFDFATMQHICGHFHRHEKMLA